MFMPFVTAGQPFQRVTNTRFSVVRHILSRKRSGWYEYWFHQDLVANAAFTLIDYFPFVSLLQLQESLLSFKPINLRLVSLTFVSRFEVCFHNDGWPLTVSAFLCVDLFDNLGCSHYVALCYLVFPYSFFHFFIFRKIYLTTVMTRISLNLKHFPFLLVWGVFGVRTQLASFSILTFFFVLPYSLRHDDFQTDLGLHDPNRISVILMRNKSVKRTSIGDDYERQI